MVKQCGVTPGESFGKRGDTTGMLGGNLRVESMGPPRGIRLPCSCQAQPTLRSVRQDDGVDGPSGIRAEPNTVAVGMTASTLGPIGVGATELADIEPSLVDEAARELEDLGYSTIWLAGRQQNNLPLISRVVRATRQIQVASGILPVDTVPAATVAEAYADLERTNPGRFLVGLGGAHGSHPLQTLNSYLDELDASAPGVPISARVLSALGPRMLALARDRSAGAHPFLITPEYTRAARSILGDDKVLAVLVMVIVESDPERARTLARQPFGFFRGPYVSSFRRMGFSQLEIDTAADRLIDGTMAWGSPEAIADKISAYREAGADQVVLSVVTPTGELPREQWRRLAGSLIS